MGHALLANLVEFGRLLRAAGLGVTPDQTRRFGQTLELLGVEHRADVRAAGRAVFARRREEIGLFDAAFDLFWRRGTVEGGASAQLPRLASGIPRPGSEVSSGSIPVDRAGERLELPSHLAASTRERLRTIDFAEMTREEARDAAAMVSSLRPRLAQRPSRRHHLAPRGRRVALRAMLRRSLASGGEALDWRWYRRDTRPRPIVLVCDISGSMEHYSRFLLRFAHALGRTGAPVEVFVFGTRLTRITRELRRRQADQALRDVALKVVDWSGGTRIGTSLHQLNRHWVRRVMRSGAVVLIVSDGWERDDPDRLGREMATLRRSCHRLIWLDPLAGQPGFEPATAGLLAVLPYVDAFLPCGTVESLESVGKTLSAGF